MVQTSGIGPSHIPPDPNHPTKSAKEPDPSAFAAAKNSASGGTPPESFAQTAWGFDAEEAKKFLSTLADTIITQIKHESDRAKETLDKLKQAEEGEDDSS